MSGVAGSTERRSMWPRCRTRPGEGRLFNVSRIVPFPFALSRTPRMLALLALPLQISVGQNILVSRERPELVHNESRLVTSPRDANRMIDCSIINGKRDRNIGMAAYLSNDGGATWRLVYEDTTTNGDSDCMLTKDGTLIVAGIRSDRKQTPSVPTLEVRRST